MKNNRTRPALLALAAWLLAFGVSGAAAPQAPLEDFFDTDYGYLFKHPAGWSIQKLPEGQSNADVRVALQAPDGSSFTVIVEKLGKKTEQEGIEWNPERKKIVEDMMSQTVEQIYKTISRNIKASGMKVGERRDLSNAVGVKFYLTTLHKMPAGKPIIVAGIHAFPYGRDYSINFLMTTFWDPNAKQAQETMTTIFNSFRLFGENPGAPDASPEKPQGGLPGKN